jgi:orotate phosphoribosyltransferase
VIVDDSVYEGKAIRRVKEQIEQAGRSEGVLYAAAFVTGSTSELVDLHGEIVEMPRVFAWNILHHPTLLKRTCVDIDGVLCLDPTREQNDDGPIYTEFLESAQPLFVPTAPVKCVVTSRLEKYRAETERWLADHGIEYEDLVMLDLPDAETRRTTRPHARHKADFYARSGADLFIESEYTQAVEIAARSGRQVFSVDRREMVYPSAGRAALKAPAPFARSVAHLPPAAVLGARAKKAARRVKKGLRRAR